MTFKAPPKIIQKVMGLKAIEHKDGKVLIFKNPAFIDPVHIQVFQYALAINMQGEQIVNAERYYTGKLQAYIGTKIMNERFGYAKTITEKTQLTEFNHGQTALMGFGNLENIRLDFKNNHFIYNGTSAFAEEYRRFLGVKKSYVDYWLAGMYAGAFEALVGKEMVGIETKCIVKGSQVCEFVIKPSESWDKTLPLVKANSFLFQKNAEIEKLTQLFKNKIGPFS